MIYDCIVIGAGPAGLMAACFLEGLKAVILEGENKPAQKLLLSGAGQCNFTHEGSIKDFFSRFGDKERFVRKALSGFSNEDVKAYFRDMNVDVFVREDGKVFPASMDAWDVFRALKNKVESNGVQIESSFKVEGIDRRDDHFEVRSNQKTIRARTIILASGGASYPMTGSDGSGHRLAKFLGHTIEPIRPALTPVYIDDFKLGSLAGISYPGGEISHYRDGKKIGDYKGDILITHMGLSGPGILDNSRYMKAGDEIRLKMLDEGASRKDLEQALLSGNKKKVRTVVSDYMTKRNAEKLIELVGISSELICAELGKKDRKTLLKYAEELPLIVKKLGNMKSAMVTAGGVSTKEVTAGTMASKLVQGLYFAGEVLDVDGDSGGYNIQWAFSSGRLAALSVKKYLERMEADD